MARISESFTRYWTPRRCYTAAAILLVSGSVLFVLLAALVISAAVEGLALKTARCTVVDSRLLSDKRLVECECGVNCKSFYPCLEILVDYVSEDRDIGVQRKKFLYYSINEEAQNTECSFEPKENGRCDVTLAANTKSVTKYQANKGVVNSSYDCYFDPDKPKLVFSEQPDRTHLQAVMANCIFWPLLMVALGIGWIVFVYCRHRFWCYADAQGSMLITEDDQFNSTTETGSKVKEADGGSRVEY